MILEHPNQEYLMGPVVSQAAALLRAQGMDMPRKPADSIPDLPEDLTSLSDKDIMSLYASFVAWSEYAQAQLACAAVDERHLEKEHAVLDARVQARYRDAGQNVTGARASAKVDPEVRESELRVIAAEAYRKLLEVVATGCDKSAALISRELTRRTSGEQYRRQGSTWLT